MMKVLCVMSGMVRVFLKGIYKAEIALSVVKALAI